MWKNGLSRCARVTKIQFPRLPPFSPVCHSKEDTSAEEIRARADRRIRALEGHAFAASARSQDECRAGRGRSASSCTCRGASALAASSWNNNWGKSGRSGQARSDDPTLNPRALFSTPVTDRPRSFGACHVVRSTGTSAGIARPPVSRDHTATSFAPLCPGHAFRVTRSSIHGRL